MCALSRKSSFLLYLAREIIKQTKELSFILISVLCWFGSIWFCQFKLEPNGTVPSAEPKEHG